LQNFIFEIHFEIKTILIWTRRR